ncbi:MAG: hypothetical protein ABSF64_32860 [Bryobacteraceae bacterium]
MSPDGRTAAYIATDHGKAALWVHPLDGATARVLAGTEDAGLPFWSPDSKSVAFFAHGKLQRVYLAGGAPQTICDIGETRGGSWSDGVGGLMLSPGLMKFVLVASPHYGQTFHDTNWYRHQTPAWNARQGACRIAYLFTY